MTNQSEALKQFDHILNQLQPGLTLADIESNIKIFLKFLPQDGYALYQCHNGLLDQPGNLSLIEKLLQQKGTWHGKLSI